MESTKEKILAADFGKLFKRWIIIALIVVFAGGGLTALLFRTQITEAVQAEKTEQQLETTQKNAPATQNSTSSAASAQKDANTGATPDANAADEHGDGHDGYDFFDSPNITQPSTAQLAGAGVFALMLGLTLLAYWLMVVAWLYKAAVKTKMNHVLWPVLGLFFNLAAVLLFLVVRGTMLKCPECGTRQRGGQYCVSCGKELQKKCPKCGTLCGTGELFCKSCGTPLASQEKEEG